jgi:hypothetical protein
LDAANAGRTIAATVPIASVSTTVRRDIIRNLPTRVCLA